MQFCIFNSETKNIYIMEEKLTCLVCNKTAQEVPLIKLEYKGNDLRICPQHIPVLIHQPQELVGKIEDADKLQAG